MTVLADRDGRGFLRRLRMAAQRLAGRQAGTPVEAVRCMLALQGQDLPGARWSVGVRVAGATEASVDAAFDAGDIVRSWPLRGTLHVVASEDLGWLLRLTAGRALASAASRRAALGIAGADIERAREIATTVLAGRRRLARPALLAAFGAGGVSTTGQRGYHLLWYLAQTGTLVLAAPEGRGQAYALLEDWVRSPRELDRDEALGELAARYVRGHGPVAAADVARWAGLTLGDVRRGLAVAGAALTTIVVEGTTYHVAADLPEEPLAGADGDGDGEPATVLLAGFDEYILGYGDRSAALAPGHADLVVPGGNGMFKPTIVVGGEVVGTWSRTIRSREVVVAPAPFPGTDRSRLVGVPAAAERYGAFLGREVRLA